MKLWKWVMVCYSCFTPHILGDGEHDGEYECIGDMVQDEVDCHFEIGGEA